MGEAKRLDASAIRDTGNRPGLGPAAAADPRVRAAIGEQTLGRYSERVGPLNQEVASHERSSREGDPCRWLFLGNAGPHPETTGRTRDEGRLQRRRRRERDLPQPRDARGGDRNQLRSRADLVPGPARALLPDPRSDDAEPPG